MNNFKRLTAISIASVIISNSIMTAQAFASEAKKIEPLEVEYNYNYTSSYLNENTYSKDEIFEKLSEIGFTPVEMKELYQKEANNFGISFRLPEKLSKEIGIDEVMPQNNKLMLQGFPSNPSIGDVYVNSTDINFDKIARILGWTGGGTAIAWIAGNCTKNAVAKSILTGTGLGWVAAAASIAGLLFSEAARHHTGVTVKIKYHYIYNNDGILDWVMGPMSHDWW